MHFTRSFSPPSLSFYLSLSRFLPPVRSPVRQPSPQMCVYIQRGVCIIDVHRAHVNYCVHITLLLGVQALSLARKRGRRHECVCVCVSMLCVSVCTTSCQDVIQPTRQRQHWAHYLQYSIAYGIVSVRYFSFGVAFVCVCVCVVPLMMLMLGVCGYMCKCAHVCCTRLA